MNKKELIYEVQEAQEKAGNKMAKGEIEAVVNSVFEIIKDKVKEQDKVSINGFASFEKVRREERNGVNPKTREKMVISARDAVKVSVAKGFLD